MILSYLVLSHLLGDFIFQPSKLVVWKMKSIYGVLVHVLIHVAIMLLIMMPFILNGNLWILGVIAIINSVHFIVDQAKISYDLKHDIKVIPFLIDQFLHFTTILSVVFLTKDYVLKVPDTQFFNIYSSQKVVVFISLMVFASKVLEVFRYQRQLENDKNTKIEFRTKNMLKRMFGFGVIYIVVTTFIFYT